eukprot:COSAG02_NODE_63239_length_263_cov_1.567073_1_plen_20_part_01
MFPMVLAQQNLLRLKLVTLC